VAHGWATPRRHRDRVGRGHEAGKETTTAAVAHGDDAGKCRTPSTELNFCVKFCSELICMYVT
jgi:hypothetical protein